MSTGNNVWVAVIGFFFTGLAVYLGTLIGHCTCFHGHDWEYPPQDSRCIARLKKCKRCRKKVIEW